jgi:cell division protein FtsZ
MAKKKEKKNIRPAKAASREIEAEAEEAITVRKGGAAAKKGKDLPIAKIKVVGVGGAGGNALTRMHDYFPRGVDLIAVNTDLQDLEQTDVRRKIYIGKQVTKGLGAGMNPEVGRQSAEESREEITQALTGADMVFLTGGFGGGTGSGALPVIAEIAQDLGILTVAIVTKPFSFEGTQRSQIAQEALARLKDRVDTYITISNDKIFSVINKDTSLRKAFEAIDEVLKNAVLGVTELIMTPGIINVDFADIRTIIQGSGTSIIGVGIGSGKDRATAAAHAAINSPLLETSIEGAKGVLFSISGHRDVTMNEINDIAKLIAESVDQSAKIIFGTYIDRKLNKGDIKVTLIATGFGSSYGAKSTSLFDDFDSFSRTPTFSTLTPFLSGSTQSPLHVDMSEPTPPAPRKQSIFDTVSSASRKHDDEPMPETAIEEPEKQQESEMSEDSAWDIPTFLRKRGKKK